MSASPNRPPAPANSFEGTAQTASTNGFPNFDNTQPPDQTLPGQYSHSLGKNDLFFDTSSHQSQHSQQSPESLVDSFTLFNSSSDLADLDGVSHSAASSAVTSQLYNPIVFNQQFSQFQRATNSGKYFPSFTQQQQQQQRSQLHHSTEITEANVDDDDEEEEEEVTGKLRPQRTPRGQMFSVQESEVTDDGGGEQNRSAAENISNRESLYENYMIDYEADYEQYYDPNNVLYHHHQQQHYTVEEGDEEGEMDEGEEGLEYFSSGPSSGGGGVIGENDVNLDMVADAKTYGLMLPPYHHFKQMAPSNSQQQQQQLHPQFQMIQHPYMYGNPFSYNLHTIIEESENESSLQTLSSVTSSNFQSLQFDHPHQLSSNNSSQTVVNDGQKRKGRTNAAQIGELSDPSLSPHSPPSSQSSPLMKEKYSKRKATKSVHHHHQQQLDSHPRSSGENFSEISFTSSSSFSENGSEPEERTDNEEEEEEEEDEDETFQVVTANTNLSELVSEDRLQNTASEPDSTTSKLERYFTSSLLEANGSNKHIIPKIEPHLMSLTPPSVTSMQISSSPATAKVDNSAEAIVKPKLTRQQALIKYRLVKLKYALRRLLLDANFRQLTLDQLHRLNAEFFRSDWIALLKTFIDKNVHKRNVVPLLLTKVYYVLRLQFTSSKLREHVVDYLADHMITTSAVHIVKSHQLAGKAILNAKTEKMAKDAVLSCQKEDSFSKSQIQITINQGQSMIIIKNESNTNPNTATVPAIPFRAKKEIKLQTIQSIRPPKVESLEDSKVIYRTVLQVNDVNGSPYQSDFSKADDRMENKRISKLLTQSNPLNRNFLVKSMLSDNAETEEKSKQHSEIYGWIQRAPSEASEQLYTTTPVGDDESEQRTNKSAKPKSTLLNSSTQLLLGSLRSRSKDRSNWSDSRGNGSTTAKHDKNSGKFKTISGNVHSKGATSSTTLMASDGHKSAKTSKYKLERSQKGSKSFRDTRQAPTATATTTLTPTTAEPTTTTSNQTTWDSIYGGGIKLLKNISFVRNRNRPSKEQSGQQYGTVGHRSASEESEKALPPLPPPSPNKSFSEPNLHKSHRNGRVLRANDRSQAVDDKLEQNIYETLKTPPPPHPPPAHSSSHFVEQLTTVVSSRSTPHLTTAARESRGGCREGSKPGSSSHGELHESTVTAATLSTPSLLYRLSNPVTPTMAGNSKTSAMTMRSISTSSLRTTRTKQTGKLGDNSFTTGQYYYAATATHNGEWQKMSSSKEDDEGFSQGSSSWTRKPSSLRVVSSSETSTATFNNFPQSTKKVVTSSHYQEIVEHVNNEQTELEREKPTPAAAPLVQTVTSESLVCSQTIGELSIAVKYEMRIGTLEILINKCRIDAFRQKADLYVKVYLLPDRSRSNKRKTRIVKAFRSITGRSPAGQLHAEFNETLRFTGPFGEFTGRKIWLSVWNNDKFGRNEPVAEMILGPLDASILSSGQLGTITWFRLVEPISTNPKPTQTSETYVPVESICEIQCTSVSQENLEFEYTGTIFLAIKYQNDAKLANSADYQQPSDSGSLHILIKEAQNLQFNISAPNVIGITFCKLLLLPERSKQDREKSAAIKCPLEYSSNPRWNQTFVFSNITATDLQKRSLEITVWFQSEHAMQKSSKKVFVGGVRLSANSSESTADEINLWNQLLDRHNMWAYGEVPLRQINNAK